MKSNNGIGKRLGIALMVVMACGALLGARAEAASKAIPLVSGWNLVSSPLEPADPTVDAVLAGVSLPYVSAWAWDAQKLLWQVRVATETGTAIGEYANSKGFLPLSTLAAGQGFWLNMTNSATLTITGNDPGDQQLTLVKGWNLIGSKGDQDKTVDQLIAACGTVGVKPLSLWAWHGGNWALALPFTATGATTADQGAAYALSKGFVLLSTLAAGEGYWLNSPNASQDGLTPLPTLDSLAVQVVDGFPVVTFTVQKGGTPISGLTTATLRAYLAELVPGAAATDDEQWQRWGVEQGGGTIGTLLDQGQGQYQYTFATPLANAPNPSHQQRLLIAISGLGTGGSINSAYDFLISAPATELPPGKDIVSTAACASCHGEDLNQVGHEGGFTDTKSCVICHSPLLDSPNMAADGLDFVTMIHQIHAAINGKHDWSAVTYPGIKSATAKMVVDCAKCHQGKAGDLWKSKPTMEACRSCHTAVVFDGVTAFTGLDGKVKTHFKNTDNAYCAMCHGGDDTYAPLAASHALPVAADVAQRTMSATIKGAVVDASSGLVKVTFTLDQGGLAVTDATALKSMGFTLAKLVPGDNGASSHWQSYTGRSRTKTASLPPVIQGYSESAKLGTATTGNAPVYNSTILAWEYTFALPNADTPGDIRTVTHVYNASAANLSPDTYTPAQHPTDDNPVTYEPSLTHRIGMEFVAADGTGNQTNATFDFVPNGSAVSQTRALVTTERCQNCHAGSKLHKGYAVEYCVTCHNQDTFDPYNGNSVDLQTIIHKLHRGASLPSVMANPSVPYTVNGTDFSDVRFPQPLTHCAACHDEGSANGQNWKKAPSRRACGTCHDSALVVAHLAEHTEDPTPSQPYSGDEIEGCLNCHGPGKAKAVETMHQ